VQPTKGNAPRWLVLGDLVCDVPRPTGDLALVGSTRADAGRPLGLDLYLDDGLLPLAMPVELIEVREHLLGRAVDLDTVNDHGSPPECRSTRRLLVRDAVEFREPRLGARVARGPPV